MGSNRSVFVEPVRGWGLEPSPTPTLALRPPSGTPSALHDVQSVHPGQQPYGAKYYYFSRLADEETEVQSGSNLPKILHLYGNELG